jgi:hypothetical protein
MVILHSEMQSYHKVPSAALRAKYVEGRKPYSPSILNVTAGVFCLLNPSFDVQVILNLGGA